MLLSPGVHGDDRHVLGDRDDRQLHGPGHPLGSAMTGAGLRGGDRGIGDEMHVGPGDAAGVGGQDDGAIHLGQLGEPLRAEGGVEQEATGTDVEHLRAVADHDECAHPGLEDAVDSLAKRLPRGDHRQGVEHGLTAATGHLRECSDGPCRAAPDQKG